MVHSVYPMLAYRAVCFGDLPLGLASNIAVAYFRHRRSWSFESDQRTVFSAGEAASRTTRHLTPRSLPIDYCRIKGRLFR